MENTDHGEYSNDITLENVNCSVQFTEVLHTFAEKSNKET